MRRERIEKSDDALDQLENQWWNVNCETIEQVWAQTLPIQKAYRLSYLKKMKAFFDSRNEQTTAWEVGCGTGWVCRLVAGEKFHVIGTDFSASQIDKANAMAKAWSKDAFCKYIVTDASTVVENNGIVIHAILHHLSKAELAVFFDMLGSQKKNTPVFLYEPVFIQARNNNGYIAAMAWKQVVKAYRKLIIGLIKITGRRNHALNDRVEKLFQDAEENGWFLSPKEVPFYESELKEYLGKHFDIQKNYFVTKSDLEIGQYLMLYNMPDPGVLFTRLFIPIATFLDNIFFKLNFRSVTKGQYFFACYELIKK